MTDPNQPSDDELRALIDGALGEEERLRIEKLLEGNADRLRRCETITGYAQFRDSFLNTAPQRTPVRSDVLVDLIGKLKAGDFTRPTAEEEAIEALDSPPSGDEPGRLGEFEILDVIACGGMGMVFRARDVKLDRLVAIKALAPRFALDPVARDRFLTEARMVAGLDHPNILPIYTVAEGEHVPYFVMRLVEGGTLSELVACSGALARKRAFRIGLQIACALESAHASDVIHRDLKPANILIEGERDRVWVADFGIAKLGGTDVGEAAGTTGFSAPEQLEGAVPSVASDLYGLGATLRFAHGELPKSLESLVASDPKARPASASEVVSKLQHMLRPPVARRMVFGAAALLATLTLFASLSPTGLSGSLNQVFGSGDFYIAGKLGTYPTLGAAISNTVADDVLLVDFDGERPLAPVIITHPLTIRAAPQSEPVFVQSEPQAEMFRLDEATVFEGLTFVRPAGSQLPKPMLSARNCPLTLIGCTVIALQGKRPALNAPVFTDGVAVLEIRDCTILTGESRWLNIRARTGLDLPTRGTALISDTFISAERGPHLACEEAGIDFTLRNVTFLGFDLFYLSGSGGSCDFDVRDSLLLAQRSVVWVPQKTKFSWQTERLTLATAAGGFLLMGEDDLVAPDVGSAATTDAEAKWIIAKTLPDARRAWAEWLKTVHPDLVRAAGIERLKDFARIR